MSDKLNYGMKLRKALREFVKDFVPHMKEEEEVRKEEDREEIVIKNNLF